MNGQRHPGRGDHTSPPTDPLRIVLAVPDSLAAEDHARLQEAGLTVLAEAGSARALARLLTTADASVPVVVFLHDALDRLDRFPDLAERIAARWGAATVLLVANPAVGLGTRPGDPPPRSTVAPAVRARARNAGYAGVTVWPGDPDDLYDAALAALSARPPVGGMAVATPGAQAAPLKPPAVLVGVRGEKGGTGKTMVAENLCALAALAGLRVLLLDMDQNGSAFLHVLRGSGALGEGKGILAFLGAYTQWRASADANPQASVRTAAHLLAAATLSYPAPAPGRATIDVLPGVRGRDQGDLLDEDQHLEALDMLSQAARSTYDLIVVDMGQSHLHSMHQGWAAEVDKLVVVTEPKFRSVAGAAEGQVKLMNTIGKKRDQCFIVVNRFHDSRYEMLDDDLRAQFSRGLGADGAARGDAHGQRSDQGPELEIVGYLRDAPELVNQGEYYHVPWVLLPDAEHHKLMDDFYAMATRLLGAGLLPERQPAAVALARVRAAVRRLFHAPAATAGQEETALSPVSSDSDSVPEPALPADERGPGNGERSDAQAALEAAHTAELTPAPAGPATAGPHGEEHRAAPRVERSISWARRQRATRRPLHREENGHADENGQNKAPPAVLSTGPTGDGPP